MLRTRYRHLLTQGAVALIAGSLLTAAAACGTSASSGAGDGVRVVAAFYPLAWLAERIGGGVDKGAGQGTVTVSTLTPPGAEPHDLELTPKQVVEVGETDLVLYIKGVQPSMDEAVEQHAKETSFDALSVVRTRPAAEGEEGHGAKAPYDPHIWLDPSRFATVATAVGDRLAKTDQSRADVYRSRARAVAADLTKLDEEFQKTLDQAAGKTIVTSHAAFGYLADRYGLRQEAIAGIDPEAEPSPKRIAELSDLVRRIGVTTVFTETLVSPVTAQTLAREAGVRTATLDPLEGRPAGSADDYLSVMRRNLDTLRTALDAG